MNLNNVILLLDWGHPNININLIATYDVKTEDGIIKINTGETMLHCACKRINRRGYENDPSAVSIIKLLIKYGADINIKDQVLIIYSSVFIFLNYFNFLLIFI
jgi:hypothetical protein